jgi:hypothetical protein
MRDSQNDEIEDTLIGIWKEFAWYLKEVAKKHDERIDIVKEKIDLNYTRLCLLENDFKTWKENSKNRFTLSLTQTIIALIGFAATAFAAFYGMFK